MGLGDLRFRKDNKEGEKGRQKERDDAPEQQR